MFHTRGNTFNITLEGKLDLFFTRFNIGTKNIISEDFENLLEFDLKYLHNAGHTANRLILWNVRLLTQRCGYVHSFVVTFSFVVTRKEIGHAQPLEQ